MINSSVPPVFDENLITTLFENQPDAVVWFTPVFGNDTSLPVDFHTAYCNSAAGFILNEPRERIIGSSLSVAPWLDQSARNLVFEQCAAVWTSNNSMEFTYFSPRLNKYLHVQRSKVNGGVLSVARDHTHVEKAKADQDEQSAFLKNLIENSPYGVSLYQSIRNAKGEITDFRLRLANQKSAEITAFSLADLHKYTVKELMLLRGHSALFDVCRKVVETGESVYMELCVAQRNLWLGFSIVKFDDGYLLNYIDITHTKNLESQARQQADMLEGILQATTAGLLVLEPIVGLSGKVLDFKLLKSNQAAQNLFQLGSEDKGRTFLASFPLAKANGLFDLYCQVLSTGLPASRTIRLTGETSKGSYSVSVSKMGNAGIVQYISEITA